MHTYHIRTTNQLRSAYTATISSYIYQIFLFTSKILQKSRSINRLCNSLTANILFILTFYKKYNILISLC